MIDEPVAHCKKPKNDDEERVINELSAHRKGRMMKKGEWLTNYRLTAKAEMMKRGKWLMNCRLTAKAEMMEKASD